MSAAQTASLGSTGWAPYAPSPVGPLFVAWTEAGVARLAFGLDPPSDLTRWIPSLNAGTSPLPMPAQILDGLDAYFAGAPVEPAALPVQLGGTRFQQRVWAALRTVLRGQVRTYAGLATDAGSPRAMRAVGAAMGANPIAILVPCHRIVGTGHSLGGYGGGLERKEILLELEGVRVHEGRVLPGQLELL